jgi:dihydroorotate dehydrogenase (NAD+) catalytic subunit
VKPVALHAIFHCRAATGLPIAGVGGVASAQDCLEFASAGASVVAIGTSLFRNPGLVEEVVAELPSLLERQGVSTFDDVVGRAHHHQGKALLEVDANHP